VLLVLVLLMSAAAAAQTASVLVLNARIWTGNPRQPWAEALAVSGDRFADVGSNREVGQLAGRGTRIIDARGAMVAPGFIDSHIHFLGGGLRLASVQLRDARSRDEFADRIRDFASRTPRGAWITGGDWDHTHWGGELPTRHWIDSFTAGQPVWVNRLDGHMALANTAALRAAGIDRSSKDVPGGEIVRDAAGNPTGVLKDNAMALVERVAPKPTAEMSGKALEAAMNYAAERGITSIHHMGDWDDLAIFEREHKAGKLKTRIYAAVPLASWERLRDKIAAKGKGDDWLRIGALKGFTDGSLGSRTAAFFEPFLDTPASRGLFVNPPEKLYEWTAGATAAGLHVMVHAIGDRAIRTQLDIFERVNREQKPRDARFRIEHAQHIHPSDISRFAATGVIASMQPYHAIDDGRWAEKAIGAARSKTTYAFRSLLDARARLAFGSDWYVAPASPLEGIYAAVTRQTLDDRNPGGWIPAQKITVDEALRAYTIDAAYASFEEDQKGSIEKRKLADFVILERDLTKVASHEIRSVQVRMTYAGGRPIYERP
jgi:predicted amidohydrolase YtcJ